MHLHMACIKHRSRAAYRTPVVQAGASQLVTGSSIWCSRAGADESVKGCCSGSGRGQQCGLGFLGPVWSTTRSYSGSDAEHQ